MFNGYHRRGRDGLNGQCPAFVRQQKIGPIKVRLPDERTAALFLEPCIAAWGTFLRIEGAHYGLGNMKIIERQGEKLKVRLDPLNAARVYVYDLDGRYITTAENAGRLAANATRDDVKTAQKVIARHNKMSKELGESAAIVHAIDPAVAMALHHTRGAIQADPLAVRAAAFKPDFSPRTDDGLRLAPAEEEESAYSCKNPLDLLSDGSEDGRVKPKTDAPEDPAGAWKLPDDIFSLFREGRS